MTPAALYEIDRSITAASSFLADSRSPDGLWRDFQTLAGESCDWVTCFVAFSARDCDSLRALVRDVLPAILRRQRPNGGWAYNAQVPTDCDSSAWGVLALTSSTVWKPSFLLRALAFLARHSTEGGFATYTAEDGIGDFIGAGPDQTKGWRLAHPCVTAVATRALLQNGYRNDVRVRAALSALETAQEADGTWRSYWWSGHSYATAQTLRALVAARALRIDMWRRTVEGLLCLQHVDGGFGDDHPESQAFATAMSLAALLTRPDPACDAAIDRAARWLLASQRGGSWGGAPILRIPPPMAGDASAVNYEVDALGTGVAVRDQKHIFTTAACLAALIEYRTAKLGRILARDL